MKILYMANLPVSELRRIGREKRCLNDNYEHFLFPLFSYMLKRGHYISILTASRDINKSEYYTQEGLTVIIIPICRHGNISALCGFRNDIYHIKQAVKKTEYDLIHAHWCYEYALAALETDDRRTVITLHDWPNRVCPEFRNYYWSKRNKIGNEALVLGKRFIAVSPYIADMLLKEHGKKAYIMPNSMDERTIERFHVEYTNQGGETKYKPFRIIDVANGFNSLKNTQTAIIAFSIFHKKNTDSELCLYGDEHGKGEMAELWTKRKGISTEGIQFKGRVGREEICNAYKEADLLLHLSREESFGLVYLEAMASDTEIIAGNNSGATPWVLNNGSNGNLVDLDNMDSILDSIDKFYQNRDLLKGNSIDYLKDNFLSEKVFYHYNLYIESIIHGL